MSTKIITKNKKITQQDFKLKMNKFQKSYCNQRKLMKHPKQKLKKN